MQDAVSLTVVIPTLNAAATLPSTLAALAWHDVVVSDGGSTDGTQDIAGVRLVTSLRGRGTQVAAGLAVAGGEWLLILHADTRLAPGWLDAVRVHIATAPGYAAHFRFRLDSPDPRARRLERAVAWRCRVLGLPYGDQGLLISRAVLAAAGGMRPLPLMEDVDLIHRLCCRPIALPVDAVTSAERWERDGWTRRSLRNLVCLSLWYAGVPPAQIARLYG